jgi:hypothetical protein
MEKYDPSHTPDPNEWLELEEIDRIFLVQQYHQDSMEEVPEGAERVHAVIHVVVENQIAMGVGPVPATIARLKRQGLNRHEAIHAVGAVLSEDMFELTRGEQKTWNQKSYRRRLEKLTAKRWRKGKW